MSLGMNIWREYSFLASLVSFVEGCINGSKGDLIEQQ